MQGTFDPYREWLGIEEERRPVNAYRLLGVAEFESDVNAILAAADARLEKIGHRSGEHGMLARMLRDEVRAARSMLIHSEHKTEYDRKLEQSLGKARYFYRQGDVVYGPMTSGQLRDVAASGRLRPTDQVRKGTAPWRRAAEMKGLQLAPVVEDDIPTPCPTFDTPATFVPPTVAAVPPPPPAPPAVEDVFADLALPSVTSSPRRDSSLPPGFRTFLQILIGALIAIGVYFTPPMQRFMHALQLLLQQEQRQKQLESMPPARPEQPHALPRPEKLPVRKQPRTRQRDKDQPLASFNLPDIIARAEPAVVRLSVATDLKGNIGSGFFISDDGLCVTNAHVLRGARSVKATYSDGRVCEATGFLLVVPANDIALLRFPEKPAGVLQLSGRQVLKGENIVAIGAPNGFDFSASNGIVSALRRMRVKSVPGGLSVIQHDAALSPGSSGGPLLDGQAELIGVNTWTIESGQNLNFAISVSVLAPIAETAAGLPPRPLSDLPTITGRELEEDDTGDSAANDRRRIGVEPKPWKLVLPNGREITPRLFEFSIARLREMFPADAQQKGDNDKSDPKSRASTKATLNYDRGGIRAMLSYSGRSLDGAAAIFREDGQPYIVTNYKNGELDGVLQIFDKDGPRLAWQEYKRDRKDGINCLFRDNRPVFIQSVSAGRPDGHFLVKFVNGDARLVPGVVEPELASNYSKELNELDGQVQETERDVKRAFTLWGRKQEDEKRQANRKQIAPLQRAQMLESIRQQELAEAAANDALWRAIMNANVPYRPAR